jgi:hypothetical protein
MWSPYVTGFRIIGAVERLSSSEIDNHSAVAFGRDFGIRVTDSGLESRSITSTAFMVPVLLPSFVFNHVGVSPYRYLGVGRVTIPRSGGKGGS